MLVEFELGMVNIRDLVELYCKGVSAPSRPHNINALLTLLLDDHSCHSDCGISCHLNRTKTTVLEALFAELARSVWYSQSSAQSEAENENSSTARRIIAKNATKKKDVKVLSVPGCKLPFSSRIQKTDPV